MKNIKDNNERARLVVVCYFILIGAHVIAAIAGYFEYSLMARVDAGLDWTEGEEAAITTVQGLAAILLFGAIIATAITFLMWFRRAYNNLHIIKIPYLKFSEGWAVGSFFVPFLNLVRPFQIMREVWTETQTAAIPEEERYKFDSNNSIVGTWWALLILSSVVDQVAYRMARSADATPELMNSIKFGILGDVLSIIAVSVGIVMIRKISSSESVLYRNYRGKLDPSDMIIVPGT